MEQKTMIPTMAPANAHQDIPGTLYRQVEYRPAQ